MSHVSYQSDIQKAEINIRMSPLDFSIKYGTIKDLLDVSNFSVYSLDADDWRRAMFPQYRRRFVETAIREISPSGILMRCSHEAMIAFVRQAVVMESKVLRKCNSAVSNEYKEWGGDRNRRQSADSKIQEEYTLTMDAKIKEKRVMALKNLVVYQREKKLREEEAALTACLGGEEHP